MFRIALVAAASVLSILSLRPASAHYWFADDGCGPGPSADGMFYAAGDEWTVYPSGYNGCGMATLNSQSVKDEYAEWYLPAYSVPNPNDYNHYFDVWTNIDFYPWCGNLSFTFRHDHAYRYGHQYGDDRDITAHVWWDQTDRCFGNWTKLSTTPLCNTSGGFWEMRDNTYDPPGAYLLVLDVILFNPANSTHSC